jgi:hypothetical protein
MPADLLSRFPGEEGHTEMSFGLINTDPMKEFAATFPHSTKFLY